MSNPESYQPSPDEIKKAEEMMTNEQVQLSKQREKEQGASKDGTNYLFGEDVRTLGKIIMSMNIESGEKLNVIDEMFRPVKPEEIIKRLEGLRDKIPQEKRAFTDQFIEQIKLYSTQDGK